MNQDNVKLQAAKLEDATEDRYLVFRIGEELFAAPLLSIREIVEPLSYRYVPNPHDYFLGLSNLRGQIIGVLDLGVCFGLKPVADSNEAVFLVFDVDGTSMAGLVNRVESVTEIAPSAISRDCQIDMLIPTEAMLGIAREANHLIPIVQLSHLVKNEVKVAS